MAIPSTLYDLFLSFFSDIVISNFIASSGSSELHLSAPPLTEEDLEDLIFTVGLGNGEVLETRYFKDFDILTRILFTQQR